MRVRKGSDVVIESDGVSVQMTESILPVRTYPPLRWMTSKRNISDWLARITLCVSQTIRNDRDATVGTTHRQDRRLCLAEAEITAC